MKHTKVQRTVTEAVTHTTQYRRLLDLTSRIDAYERAIALGFDMERLGWSENYEAYKAERAAIREDLDSCRCESGCEG